MSDLIKRKALESMGGNAAYAVGSKSESPGVEEAPKKASAMDEGGWGESLVKALVALAPVGIGAAAGGASGVVAGSKAADTIFDTYDQAKKARAAAAEAKDEKDLKNKTYSLAERKQIEEERDNKQKNYLKMIELQGKGKEHPPLKTMASEQINTLAESGMADKMLSDLENTLNSEETASLMGPMAGRISQANPLSTGGKALAAKLLAATQMIGRSLEGRGLTEPDFDKYQRIFPSMTDRPDVAKAKLAQIKKSLAARKAETLKTLNQSGYDVSGFPAESPEVAQAQAAQKPGMMDQVVSAAGPASANAAQAAPDFHSMSEEQLKKYLGH